jgi:hypothetical protein
LIDVHPLPFQELAGDADLAEVTNTTRVCGCFNACRIRARTALIAVLLGTGHYSSVLPGPDKIPQRFAGASKMLYAMQHTCVIDRVIEYG